MVNYQKSVIYKLCCKDTTIKDIYIGSSVCKDRRKNEHKTHCNNSSEKNKHRNRKVYKFIRENGGFNNWDMIIIEEYPCDNRIQLLQRERYWMEELNPTLNVDMPISEPEIYNKNREKEKKRQYKQLYKNVLRELLNFDKNITIITPQIIKEIYNQRRIRWNETCKRFRIKYGTDY